MVPMMSILSLGLSIIFSIFWMSLSDTDSEFRSVFLLLLYLCLIWHGFCYLEVIHLGGDRRTYCIGCRLYSWEQCWPWTQVCSFQLVVIFIYLYMLWYALFVCYVMFCMLCCCVIVMWMISNSLHPRHWHHQVDWVVSSHHKFWVPSYYQAKLKSKSLEPLQGLFPFKRKRKVNRASEQELDNLLIKSLKGLEEPSMQVDKEGLFGQQVAITWDDYLQDRRLKPNWTYKPFWYCSGPPTH